MSYDRDGSAVVVHDGSTAPLTVDSSFLRGMNDEADTVVTTVRSNLLNELVTSLDFFTPGVLGVPPIGPGPPDLQIVTNAADYVLPSGKTYVCVVFPQLRNLAGHGARIGGAGTYQLQTSPDTTNGLDGTWTNQGTALSNTFFDPSGASHRLNITAETVNGIKAVRFSLTGLGTDRTVHGIHLYGSIAAGQTPDRLTFTDRLGNPVGGAFFDWGDVAQGSSADIHFAIKNISSTKTASSVVVSVEALTDTTPSVAAEHLLSLDDSSFSSLVTIPTLGPGASQNVAVRRVTPTTAPLSVWDARIVAVAGSYA